ncbi:MAG: bifunctional nicotinamidase/pyrazinamidase [Bacteroidota bacterium]
MKALILVDIQNDFVPGGALAVKDGDQIIPFVNELQKDFELIVATQDFHPADHGSFAANHPTGKAGEIIDLHGLDQVLWPVHCVQGKPGADFVASLDMSRVKKIFPKGTDPKIDSYSGFFDNGKRKSTGLSDYLRAEGVKEVHVVGLAADYCVKFTALDAKSEGFHTSVYKEGTKGVNLQAEDTQKSFEEMKKAGIVLI